MRYLYNGVICSVVGSMFLSIFEIYYRLIVLMLLGYHVHELECLQLAWTHRDTMSTVFLLWSLMVKLRLILTASFMFFWQTLIELKCRCILPRKDNFGSNFNIILIHYQFITDLAFATAIDNSIVCSYSKSDVGTKKQNTKKAKLKVKLKMELLACKWPSLHRCVFPYNTASCFLPHVIDNKQLQIKKILLTNSKTKNKPTQTTHMKSPKDSCENKIKKLK